MNFIISLFFAILLGSITVGKVQAMQNPLLSGVNRVEVACLFDGTSFDEKIENRLCKLLVEGAAKKIGIPTIRNDEARPKPLDSDGIIRLGFIWIEARFFNNETSSISGQLTWGNAKPMRGVANSQNGDIVSLLFIEGDEDIIEEERAFISSLLDTIKF